MLKREFKSTNKSLIIWLSIIMVMFLFVFLLYPSIISNTDSAKLNAMLEAFSKDFLKAFNMDITDISTAFGWFKSEGNTILSLMFGVYSSILGSSILLKEESNKTIEFLYSKPISRNYILKNKIICGITNLFIINIASLIFISIGLYISNCLDFKVVVLMCITQLLSMILFFLLSLYISTFFKKEIKTISISLGLVFVSYFLLVFSLISDKISFLKFASIYYLSDTRNIIENSSFNIANLGIGIFLYIVLIMLIYRRYNKKELC